MSLLLTFLEIIYDEDPSLSSSSELDFFLALRGALGFGSTFLGGDFLVEPFGLPRPFLAGGDSDLSGSALRFCPEKIS